jgi:putative multiple sugar transport system permease protein
MTAVAGLKDLFTRNLRQSGIFIAFVVIVGLFTILTDGILLSPGNVTNIVLQFSYILILAIGMLIVIVAGHIDLSVGSVVALTGSVAAIVVIKNGEPWWVGVLAALAVGVAVGCWQGFWVAYVGIPAFIVTLAGMLLFRGMTLRVLDNVSLSPFPHSYQHIAGGFLNGFLGGQGIDVFTLVIAAIAVLGYAVSQVRQRAGRIRYQQVVESMPIFVTKLVLVGVVVMAFAYQLARSRGLPIVLIILGVLIMVYTIVTTKTVFGRHVYAIGGNLSAAQLSGVKVQKVNFWIFVNMGFLAAVAGAVYSSRSNSAQPQAGQMFELDAIAACFIGGASTTGGVGRVTGAVVGGLIMGVMSNGMQLMGIDQSVQQMVKGLVLLLAVAFDIYNKRRAGAAR